VHNGRSAKAESEAKIRPRFGRAWRLIRGSAGHGTSQFSFNPAGILSGRNMSRWFHQTLNLALGGTIRPQRVADAHLSATYGRVKLRAPADNEFDLRDSNAATLYVRRTRRHRALNYAPDIGDISSWVCLIWDAESGTWLQLARFVGAIDNGVSLCMTTSHLHAGFDLPETRCDARR